MEIYEGAPHPDWFPSDGHGESDGTGQFRSEANLVRSIPLVDRLMVQWSSSQVNVLELHLKLQATVTQLLVVPISGDQSEFDPFVDLNGEFSLNYLKI